MEYMVDEIKLKTELSTQELANKLGIHATNFNRWNRVAGGLIPERYHKKVEKLLSKLEIVDDGQQDLPLEDTPVVKKKTRKKKEIVVEKVPEKKPEESSMVCLVGKSKEILAILKEMNF